MKIKKDEFKHSELGIELDVYLIDEKEWFKAKDISDFLGYSEAKDMTRIISFEENINRHIVPNVVNPKGTLFINEFGLYEIICKINKTDSTRFNKAREFQKWVFGIILPSIRKNNFYINEDITDEQKDKLISDLTAQTENSENLLLNNKKRKLVLETCLKDMFPNVPDIYEQFLNKMRMSGMLTESNRPTEKFREKNLTYGLFRHHEDTYIETTTKFTLTNNGINHLIKTLRVVDGKLQSVSVKGDCNE